MLRKCPKCGSENSLPRYDHLVECLTCGNVFDRRFRVVGMLAGWRQRIADQWRDDRMPFLLVAFSVAVVLIGVVAGVAAYRDGEAWEAYKVEHHCNVVEKQSASSGVVVNPSAPKGSNPVSVVVISGKTGWLCDDGILYWR